MHDFEKFIQNSVQNQPINKGQYFQTNWRNLRISYFPNQEKIKISNSLHKFFNAEILKYGLVNHNDFTKSNVCETIHLLEDVFDRSSSEMKLIGRFEYGLNINTNSIKPYDIIERYTSIVTTSVNPFYAFYNKQGKPYSKFCSFTNYNVKAYDKSKEAGLTSSNIFRFEIVHHTSTKTKQVFGKRNVTLEDLKSKIVWDKCFRTLVNSYNSIRMLGFPERGVSDYAKMLCYSHPLICKDYKDDLRKIKKELKEVHDATLNSIDNPHSIIKNGLINSYQKLITN